MNNISILVLSIIIVIIYELVRNADGSIESNFLLDGINLNIILMEV